MQLRRGLYAISQGFGGDLTPLQCELVTAASQESQKLDDLMADLIEVAEIDVGKRDFNLENLRPLPMLREARDRYCEQAAEKRISIEINAYADLSYVRADRRALRSILDNLLSNAHRFTPGRRRDSARRRGDEGIRAIHGARQWPRHRSRTPEDHLRPLRLGFRNGHRPGPRPGPPAGRVAGRADRRRKPPRPRRNVQVHPPVAAVEAAHHPVEVG